MERRRQLRGSGHPGDGPLAVGTVPKIGNGFGHRVASTREVRAKRSDRAVRRKLLAFAADAADSPLTSFLYRGIQASESATELPICLDGARHCPPEDVGGVS